jgi:hypothetical protein
VLYSRQRVEFKKKHATRLKCQVVKERATTSAQRVDLSVFDDCVQRQAL